MARDAFPLVPQVLEWLDRLVSSSDATKVCPHCAETIKAAAIIYRFCQSHVGPSVHTTKDAPGTEAPGLFRRLELA